MIDDNKCQQESNNDLLLANMNDLRMFFTAGNLRGIKSPLGIRIGLLIAIILVSACEIVNVLYYAGVIQTNDKLLGLIIGVASQSAVLIGYIVGACLSKSIKSALRN